MKFQHHFGSFHETVTVDGKLYTFEQYKALDSTGRADMRAEAFDRCVDANVRLSDAGSVIQDAIRDEYATKLTTIPNRFKRGTDPAVKFYAKEARRELLHERQQKLVAVWDQLPKIDGCSYPAAVSDIFFVWETKCETEWERFVRLVSSHDWYYHYSDDHRTWSAGQQRHDQIMKLVEKLRAPAQKLYWQKCPFLNDDGTEKKEGPNG